MKKLSNSVPFRWFLSYLTIFVVAISAGVGISAYGRSLVKGQTNQIYDAMLQQIQTDLDAYIQDVHRFYLRLSLNTDVSRILNQRIETLLYDEYLASQSLLNHKADNASLEDVFVYNSNTGKVISVSGHLDADYFFDLYYADSGLQLEEFTSNLTRQNQREYRVVHGERQSRIFFFHSVPFASAGTEPINACAVMDLSQLTRRLENSRWDSGLSLAVMAENGDLVTFTGVEDIPEALLNEAIGSGLAEASDPTGAIFVQDSSTIAWRYIVYAPSSLYTSLTGRLTLVAFVVMVVCATLCVFLTLFFVRGNYRPLSETINILGSSHYPGVNKKDRAGHNEFTWLQETARLYVEEMDQSQNKLLAYNQRLRFQLLLRLLESPFDLQRDPREMAAVGLEFHRPNYMVLHFYFDDSQAMLLSNDIERGRRALGFAIVNIFGELMGPAYHVEALDMAGRMSVVMNFTEDEAFAGKLIEAASAALDHIGNHLGAVVQCAAGAVHSGPEGIYLSSREATEAAAYLSAGGSEGIVLYEDVKNLLRSYEYPLELEYQLLDALTTCDCDAAVKHLRQVFSQNEAVMGEMRRCLLMDLAGTLIKAAGMVGNPALAAGVNLNDVAVRGEEKQLEALAQEFCKRLAAERQDSSNHQRLIKQMRSYVEENFSNPELNVSRIGHHFNMTPDYLSALFRDETGRTLLEYITHCRIRRAKELLKEGHNIQEVSLAAGFRNSNAFIRVFKRVQGTTPGQWVEGQ